MKNVIIRVAFDHPPSSYLIEVNESGQLIQKSNMKSSAYLAISAKASGYQQFSIRYRDVVTWRRIKQRETNPMQAWFQGLVQIDGDRSLGMKMQRMFHPSPGGP